MQRWAGENGGIKGRLTLDSIEKIANYRNQTVEEVRAWLEGREPELSSPGDGMNWVEEIRELRRSVKRLQSEVSTLEVIAVRSIADLIHCWMAREQVSYEQFELMVLSRFPGRYDRQRLRRIAAGEIPAEQITQDDLAAIGTTTTKSSGELYTLPELEAIRDQDPRWPSLGCPNNDGAWVQ